MKPTQRKRKARGEENTNRVDATQKKRNLDKNSNNNLNKLSGLLSTPGQFLDVNEVIELLSQEGDDCLASVPLGEKNNVYFIIRNTRNPWKIHKGGLLVFRDDCGDWDARQSSRVFICLGNLDGMWKQVILKKNNYHVSDTMQPLSQAQQDTLSIIKLHRYSTAMKNEPMYQRRITVLSDTSFGKNKALIEYCGARSTTQHLNFVTSINPILNVYETPMATETLDCQKIKLNELPRDVNENKGMGLNGNNVAGSKDYATFAKIKKLIPKIPREKQALLAMLSDDPGVQALISRKGEHPCVILYNKEQLSDMKRNLECENVLGVDCTHKFGDCYITMTVYQNARAIHEDTNEPLLFLGPVFLHWDKQFLTYVSFFSHLMNKMERLKINFEVRLGNDVRLPLFKALRFAFPDSKLILDSTHLKRSLKQELYELSNYKENEWSLISEKVFGVNGLTSSPTSLVFRKRLSDLAPYFEEFPTLKTYLIKMSEILYKYYCEPLQKGVLPRLWESCRNEVLNSHMQSVHHLDTYDLPVLVEKMSSICVLQMDCIDD